jgi:O-antigen/teichoic acid export membrane protein
MVACILSSLLKAALILSHAPLSAFAAAGVVEIALSAVGWWWTAKAQPAQPRLWRYEKTRIFSLLRESWPLAVGGLAIYVQAYADQLVIGAMLGGEEVGQYSAALRLVAAFSFIPMVVQVVASPEITRAKHADETLYQRRLHGLYRLMFVLFLVTALPLMMVGPSLTRLLYGGAYEGAVALLPWMAFRLFFTNLSVARGVFITNEGLFRFALLTSIAGAAVNVGLNFLLVPRYGSKGAIAASFVSFGVTAFALEVFQPRARENLRSMAKAVFLTWRPLR